jgi:hypothetical protein
LVLRSCPVDSVLSADGLRPVRDVNPNA